MAYRDIVSRLDPDVVARLRRAVATGRWPDGSAVTAEQREHSLQAVIAWEAENLPPEQRVGFIDQGAKARGVKARGADADGDAPAPLRWADDGSGAGE